MSKTPAPVGRMEKWHSLLLLAICAGVVAAWGKGEMEASLFGRQVAPQEILSACSGATMLFPRPTANPTTPASNDPLAGWISMYHARTGAAIESTLLEMKSPDCSIDRSVTVPAAVGALAYRLPPWAKGNKVVALADTPAVLLEHLRVYECTLREWDTFLPTQMSLILAPNAGIPAPLQALGQTFFLINQATEKYLKDHWTIALELATAQTTLHRALVVLTGSTRFAPLTQNLTCLQQASVDLRNVLGLAADASACMPRAWDARDPLRNLAQ